MNTQNSDLNTPSETPNLHEIPISLQAFEKAGKELGLSGKTELEPFVNEIERELELVETKFGTCLEAFEDKMDAELEKIEALLENLEEKQEEIREKTQYLNTQLPQLRKVYAMTEIEDTQRRKIQNSLIDGEIEEMDSLRASINKQIEELNELKISQVFVQAREEFAKDTQKFAAELLSAREQIKAFQLGFAIGKGIYDDIQAMNSTPPPPPTSPPEGDENGHTIHVNGNGHTHMIH